MLICGPLAHHVETVLACGQPGTKNAERDGKSIVVQMFNLYKFIYLFTVFVLFNVFQCFHSYKSSEKSLTSPPLFMRAWKRRSFGTTRGDHMGHMGHMAWKVHDVSGCVWMCPDVPLLPQTTATNVSEC